VANTSAARSSSSSRHCPIWFGWTLYCSDSSIRVFSPLIAAKATVALNFAEWFLRGRFMVCSSATSSPIRAELPLTPLSDYPGPLLQTQTAQFGYDSTYADPHGRLFWAGLKYVFK
jgi:hypothetical protein